MAQKDVAKKILADYNDVFADIVNGLLFGGEDVVKEDELVDAQTVSQYKADDGILHEQERDVAKIWRNCGVQIAFIGMENQTGVDKLMPLRVLGYDGAAYRSQMLAGKGTVKPCPVVTLVLYFGEERWESPRSLYDCLDVPERLAPFVSDYRINVFEVAHLTPEQVKRFRSDFRVVADFFVQQRTNRDYQPTKDVIRHVDEMLKLLRVLSQDSRFGEIDPKELGKLKESGGVTMCEVLDKVENRGIAIGMERGMAQGMERGIAQGMERGVERGWRLPHGFWGRGA